ncbi:DUF1015 domain-containing protein [Scatolibacter rhodanostii]|uniref:DUF1015 domain-containing protein n=1 Tax=Scatolibacter rhodanostii TaxID=2014781 RepID=UPI000C085706|nr:DUF1015 domain-containing protein [Scatolibacter rhodanostii]
MAQIKAFKGMRYGQKAGNIEELVCPPYDIISDKERAEYLARNEHNVIRLELPKGENPYEEAGDILKKWLSDGVLQCDMDEGLYIYELEFKENVTTGETKSLKGIICRVRIEDFANNVVLPHEETLSKAKEDRLNLTKATNCNFSQIYSLYQDEKHVTRERMENLSKSTAPRYEFDDGLVIHRLWVVNDKAAIEAIAEDFAPRKLYIADGHHRYETSINYRNYCRENNIYNPSSEYVMMYLADMADEGLVVFPTHRLVRDMESFDTEKMLQDCEQYFAVEKVGSLDEIHTELAEASKDAQKAFGFYDGETKAVLTLKDITVMRDVIPEQSDAYRFLDVSILHSLVLEKLLGIDKENMANQVNLTYTRSFDEAVESTESGKSNCAFFLNSTLVSEIGAVAANGEKMPQKSTYFYPKLTTGLVMNCMNED